MLKLKKLLLFGFLLITASLVIAGCARQSPERLIAGPGGGGGGLPGDNDTNDTGNQTTYMGCTWEGNCVVIVGSGTDECDVASDCWHKECVYNNNGTCVNIIGPGTDECTYDWQCNQTGNNT